MNADLLRDWAATMGEDCKRAIRGAEVMTRNGHTFDADELTKDAADYALLAGHFGLLLLQLESEAGGNPSDSYDHIGTDDAVDYAEAMWFEGTRPFDTLPF